MNIIRTFSERSDAKKYLFDSVCWPVQTYIYPEIAMMTCCLDIQEDL